MEEYKKYWRNYTNFKGRSTRRDYWMVFLFNFLIGLVLGFLSGSNETVNVFDGITSLYSLATLIPGLAIFTRRMHDTNKSGWNWLFGLIPIAGFIILIVFLCQDSVNENNKYGPIAQ